MDNDYCIRSAFLDGIKQAYRFVSQDEAIKTTASLIACFTDETSSLVERLIIANDAGRYCAAIKSGDTRERIEAIYSKCFDLKSGEALLLTSEEKLFLKRIIESVPVPFYEQ